MSTSVAPTILQNALSGWAMLWLHGPGLLQPSLSSQLQILDPEHSSIIIGTRKLFQHTPGRGKLLSPFFGSLSGMAAISILQIKQAVCFAQQMLKHHSDRCCHNLHKETFPAYPSDVESLCPICWVCCQAWQQLRCAK